MKHPGAYYLFLIYLLVFLKPLVPVVSDWWAHEFNPIEHQIKVHAVYGSKHLQHEIAESETDNKTSSHTSSDLKEQLPYHQPAVQYQFNPILVKKAHSYAALRLSVLPNTSIGNQGPPPKFYSIIS